MNEWTKGRRGKVRNHIENTLNPSTPKLSRLTGLSGG